MLVDPSISGHLDIHGSPPVARESLTVWLDGTLSALRRKAVSSDSGGGAAVPEAAFSEVDSMVGFADRHILTRSDAFCGSTQADVAGSNPSPAILFCGKPLRRLSLYDGSEPFRRWDG